MKSINHEQLKEHIKIAYEKRTPLFIWGTFGIGKSSLVRQVADELGLECEDVRLTTLEPSDLRGLPKIDDGVTKWLPPSWLPRDKKGILFLDEINLALPSIQASAYQLILDRKLGEYSLPPNWVVICAGNRIEDRANVFELPTPLANRFTHIDLAVPSVEVWQEWGLKNNIDGRIIAFLNFKPSRLFAFDGKIKEKSIPTPRSWSFASTLIQGVEDLELIERLVSSAVGEGTAVEFCAFLKLQRKIDIKEILDNPKKVKEIKEIDLKYSLLSTATEYYKKLKKDDKILEKILCVCENLEPEFAVLLLRLTRGIDENNFDKKVLKMKPFDSLAKNYGKYLGVGD